MMKLSQLFDLSQIQGGDVDITSLTCDSRAVTPGALFAALPGTVADGRDYIESAIEKGASAILSTKGLPIAGVPYVGVDEPRLAYSDVAAKLYAGQPKTLVAMTGTNGKSSTVEFLRQIWAYAGKNAACFGTLGIQGPSGYQPLKHTTPDAVALHKTLSGLAGEGVTHAGMEASSHGLKQYRLDGVKLAAAGFSNLTQDHFDYHPDMEDYFLAKARLFAELTPADAPVVINVNDEYGRRLADICAERGQKVMRVGWAGEDIRIGEVMPKSEGQLIDLLIDGQRHKVMLPLIGEYQVLNAVSALGLAMVTGIDKDTALKALESLKGVAGRLEEAGRTRDGAPVLVDFAHTEDGLDKLLRGVRPHTMGKLIVVFGCGGDRDPDKRPKMGAVAAKLADEVIVTDDNPRTEDAASIRKAVMAGCPDATEIGDREAAIREGVSRLKAGDCLVIAGKGHEQGQIIGTEIVPFSDVAVAKRILADLTPLWTAQEAAKATGGEALGEWSVNGLSIDTRSIQVGDLFVPLKDARDGHEFIPQAVKAGAGAVITERDDTQAPALKVKDSLKAMEDLGVAARQRSKAVRFAVTGSVGKTSVKEAIAHICESAGATHKSQKSFNNHWGVPLTLATMPKSTDYGVFETGMNHAGELSALSPLVEPNIAVITKIAAAHMAHFNSLDDIAAAKSEIFDGMKTGGMAILNADDDYFDFLSTRAKQKGLNVLSFGYSQSADARLSEACSEAGAIKAKLTLNGEDHALVLPQVGEHWLMNGACAVLAASVAGIAPAKAVKALASMGQLAGRGETFITEVDRKTLTVLDESYNANPESMRAAISALMQTGKGRKLAVLGDMFELGADELNHHADLAVPLQAANVSGVICVGARMKALHGALPKALQLGCVENWQAAKDALMQVAQDGDMILVKGSNSMGLGKLVSALKENKKDNPHVL